MLLDTNVISEARRPDSGSPVRARLLAMAAEDQFLSVISLGEIAHGIARLDPGKRRRELEEWLGQTERQFAEHLLPVDRDTAQLWGELTAQVARAGRVLPVADGLIAATAIRHGLRLMTRNVKDFESTGVLIINPWDAAEP